MQFNFLETIDNLITALIYLIVSFVLFLIGKKVYQLFHRSINMDQELVEKDNLAFSFANVGYYIAMVIVISAVYSGEGIGHIVDDLIEVGIYGLLSIFLLNVSILISDKVILRKFSIKKEIVEDQNVGVGILEAAICIANSLVIYGVITENQDNFFEILILWLIAQFVLALVSVVYNKITPYDIHEYIKKDNVAVGIGFSGAIVAVANLVRFGTQMEADSWIVVGENLLLETGIGLLLLPLARVLTDKILLPKRNLTDEIVNQEKPNNGAAIIEAFSYIGGSILICLSFA
ncbi:uncharacterized protein DUF350 [Aquimarina sp. MAR_2010_214]|uniref:DUF350 domain-containing protein n=1 Tax=Aquimarina sp. MAR_2010_214 TaxID=1250026 RepID=UPI000C712E18|nr:DUF350 domain-containing protein [Aquimarina sp. MAR_2010_214]PKV48028.1 uncharacterized protein DUF350 [Aquimarina sp. MAR_2010_214]